MAVPPDALTNPDHPDFMVRELSALMQDVYNAVLDGKLVQIKIEGEQLIELIPAPKGDVQ